MNAAWLVCQTLKSTLVSVGAGLYFTFCHRQNQIRGRVPWAVTRGSGLSGALPLGECPEVTAFVFIFAPGSATYGADLGHHGMGSGNIRAGRSLVINLSKPFILKMKEGTEAKTEMEETCPRS